MDEFDLIQNYFAPLAGPEGLNLKDDAAHFNPPQGFELVLTNDTIVEGVHFPNGVYGADVAERLLRVNLSDLAAKAARPRGYLLSIAWPKHLNLENLSDFSNGLKQAQEKFGVKLWGGDTVSTTGAAVFTITMIGLCPSGMSPKRSGARKNDDIWMTGHLGKGYLGLASIEGRISGADFSDAFYRPEPRMDLRKALQTYASAAIDISDGFVADLKHLMSASGIGAIIETSKLFFPSPVLSLIEKDPKLLDKFLTHGDDYEILFTAHRDYREKLEAINEELGFSLSRIGHCIGEAKVTLLSDGNSMSFDSEGYKHFQ